MAELHLTIKNDSENESDTISGSMETADECLTEPNPKQCKGVNKNLMKMKPKTNLKKRQTGQCGQTTMKTSRKLTKINPKKENKLNKKCDKCCTRSEIQRKVAFLLDKDVCDPSKLVLDCDPCCDYPDRKRPSLCKRFVCKSRTKRKEDPSEINLLLELLKSAKNRRTYPTHDNVDCRETKIENLKKWFICNLNERFGLCECPIPGCRQPCNPCCLPMCPTITCDQPTNKNWNDFIKHCQKKCCGIMCPLCCAKSKQCYLPCQGLVKPIKCEITTCTRSPKRSPCCCISCSDAPRKSSKNKESKKISKRSVPDEDVKIQTRTWLLEKNKQLKKELTRLRKKEKCMSYVCCEHQTDPDVSRGHVSTLLWEFLLESMVKALVETRPRVWDQEKVCPCRMRAVDFVFP